MDWQRLLALGALLGALAACGGSSLPGQPLAPGQRADRAARAIESTHVLSKHALAYRVAIAAHYVVSVELRSEFELIVRPWPGTKEGKRVRRVRLDDATYDISDLVVDNKGERAYVASSAGWVRSYKLQSMEMENEWRTGSGATALAITPDGKYLLIGTDSGLVCLRRLGDGAQLQCMVAHAGRLASLSVSNTLLASGSWSGEVTLWGLPALNKISQLPTSGSVADLALSPDASLLAVARNRRPPVRTQAVDEAERRSPLVDLLGENRIELHHISTDGMSPTPSRSLSGHHALISCLAWLGTDLVSGSWDHSLQLWNTKTGSRSARLADFPHILRDLATVQFQSLFALAGWAPGRHDPAISWGRLRYGSGKIPSP